LATSDVAGILNAPALNPLRRFFVFIFNAFEVLDGAGIESKPPLAYQEEQTTR
ncbi:hypothetical protein KVU64_004157, partial [Shigella flexneri]|nr:hypothetical protein [Shigella flexneri]